MARKVETSRMLFVVVAVVIITGGVAYALWWYFAGPSTSRYEPLLADIRDKRVADGDIILSGSNRDLTANGFVYVTHRPDGSFVAMFPTYAGKGISIAGLLYTSRPLTEDDTHANPNAVNMDQRYIAVGSWHHMAIDQRLNEHWYRASLGVE